MKWPKALLDDAESLLNQLVQLDPSSLEEHALAARLDIIERLVELLRLRSGRLENALSMTAFLEGGVFVSSLTKTGSRSIHVGADSHRHAAGRYRRQSELQVALLMHLLHDRSKLGRIGDDLHRFILAVGDHLGPCDVETTRTGVTRIATTTRDASRALRLFGLLRDTEETRARTWELSLLGILVAVALSAEHPKIVLPPLAAFTEQSSRFGDSERLAVDVERVVSQFRTDDSVKASLLTLCARDAGVFRSFDNVVRTIASFCESLAAYWDALDRREATRGRKEIKAAADAMLLAVERAVDLKALAADVNKSLALDELPGLGPRLSS